MKSMFLTAIVVLSSSLGLASQPHAQGETGLGWLCGMTFEGTSKGVQFIIGNFKTEATGTLECLDSSGARFERPVRISMINRSFAPAMGLGYFEFKGVTAQISLMNASPDMLLGEYYLAQGQIAVVGGVSLMTATKLGTPQLAFQLSLQANEGIGFHVGLNKMTISAL
ncbi:MAG: hypothetical protein ACK5P5_08240 [Pseudobdellovibrionaceae bacterium]